MIYFDQNTRLIHLSTPKTSYLMKVTADGYLGHVYYGKRLEKAPSQDLLRLEELSEPSEKPGEKVSFLDNLPFEYPTAGVGDFRESCLDISSNDNVRGIELFYKGYQIRNTKPEIKGLPASFDHTDSNCETLSITLRDDIRQIEVELNYTVYSDLDVITRWAVIKNCSNKAFYIDRALSMCIDAELDDYSVLYESGAWAREHQIQFQKVKPGTIVTESVKGESGHESQPFLGLISSDCSEESGEAYGFSLVYSGNFLAKVQTNSFGMSRTVLGIHPENFRWKLLRGESFYTPEVIMTYSDAGLGGMTRTFHRFIHDHIIRSAWKDKQRPILVNNWEATYLDFDDKKLISILGKAKESGLDMLVIDDGWFRKSKSEPEGGLGDWLPVDNKLPEGLKPVSEAAIQNGMKLGLWFEPEMISEDSELYRSHPEYVLSFPGRRPAECRNQWMLDFSNPKVLELIYEKIAAQIKENNLSYIKWDMNRPICDAYSHYLPADRQGEVCYRHVLGVYQIQERLLKEFPWLLIENCSSGGARFDCGMLYYSPQIWTSDDMDPIERLSICEGTELIYPVSTMGAHVCKNRNDISGRNISFDTRGLMAMAGTFGYELDITAISADDISKIPSQIKLRKRLNDLVNKGEYYRIKSYRRRVDGPVGGISGNADCFELISEDRSEAAVWFMQPLAEPNQRSIRIKTRALSPDFSYRVIAVTSADAYFDNNSDGRILDISGIRGEELNNAGLCLKLPREDFTGILIMIEKC